MTATDVSTFMALVERLGLTVWLDGGWGVDALLGRQSRSHDDLDIVIEQREVEVLRRALRGRGYRELDTDDRTAWNFVMGDAAGRRVDFHVVVRDRSGDGIYGPASRGQAYPAAALTGAGSVAGRPVRCLTADYQMRSHTGYELDANDLRDVYALHDELGVPLPEEYERHRARAADPPRGEL